MMKLIPGPSTSKQINELKEFKRWICFSRKLAKQDILQDPPIGSSLPYLTIAVMKVKAGGKISEDLLTASNLAR